MIIGLLALVMFQPLTAGGLLQKVTVEQIEPLGQSLAGRDYLLIVEAARHPKMRSADLSCYRIYVHRRQAARWVSFIGAKERTIKKTTENGTVITHLPPDPTCRSISFEMNEKGRVARVILTRH